MTAPAVPVTPVVDSTPAAPAPVQRSFNATIAKVSGQTGIAADAPVAPPPTVAIVRNAAPTPDAPARADAPAGTTPPVEAATPSVPSDALPADTTPETAASAPPTAASETPSEPTGELSVDDGTLILRAERNADGTYKAKFDPNAKLDFEMVVNKDTGEKKQFSKTLPEIVRLARDGIALQQTQQAWKPEIEYYRNNIPKWKEAAATQQGELTTARQQLADLRELTQILLTADDETVIQHRERYQQENSPQKQAERERSTIQQERQRLESERLAIKADTFINNRLASAIRSADGVLDPDTVMGMIARATQPLLNEHGQIPPERWGQVEQFINGPFAQRVAAEKAKQDKAKAAQAAHDAATKRAQAVAQQAVNDTGRAAVPVGGAAPDRAPALPKPKNAREAIDRMVKRPLPSTVGSGP